MKKIVRFGRNLHLEKRYFCSFVQLYIFQLQFIKKTVAKPLFSVCDSLLIHIAFEGVKPTTDP